MYITCPIRVLIHSEKLLKFCLPHILGIFQPILQPKEQRLCCTCCYSCSIAILRVLDLRHVHQFRCTVAIHQSGPKQQEANKKKNENSMVQTESSRRLTKKKKNNLDMKLSAKI